MTEKTSHSPWAALLQIQRVISLVFLFGAVVFPVYILYRHGLSVLPVYDRSGNVVGEANYFVVSLGFSAFTLLISWLSYKAAQKALRQIRGGK